MFWHSSEVFIWIYEQDPTPSISPTRNWWRIRQISRFKFLLKFLHEFLQEFHQEFKILIGFVPIKLLQEFLLRFTNTLLLNIFQQLLRGFRQEFLHTCISEIHLEILFEIPAVCSGVFQKFYPWVFRDSITRSYRDFWYYFRKPLRIVQRLLHGRKKKPSTSEIRSEISAGFLQEFLLRFQQKFLELL